MKLRHEIASVLLLLVIAAPPRLLGLDALPPGLFHDEAYEGIDAARILAGARPVFLPENYGREPLFGYVMAAFVALDGPTATAVRATAALFGLLSIPAAYLWARTLFGPRAALLTAALVTASYWMLHESRVGMRPIALPPLLALASAFAWLAARRGRAWAWPLGGLILGLSLYTYLPARLFPLVVAGQVALGLGARRSESGGVRSGLAGAALLFAVAAVVALPLALHFQAHPDDLTARSGAVSVLATESGQVDPVGALARSALLNLGMFVWRGDDTLRHNLPHRPVFDLLVAPFFLLGAAVSVRRLAWRPWGRARPSSDRPPDGGAPPLPTPAGRAEHAALWLWLAVMLVPGLLGDSAPHFLRTIGLLPALFALPALGLLAAADWLRDRLPEGHRSGRAALAPTAAVAAILLASQLLTWWDYFVRLPREPGLAETFDAPRANLARVAGDPPPGLDLALPTPGWSYATIRFLRPRAHTPPAPSHPAEARFDRHALLLGYDLTPDPLRPDRPARLVLHWRALRELNASFVRTARIVDPYGRAWWESEGVPGAGTLPTDTWTPEEYVPDRLTVDLNPGTPSGDYQLEIVLAQPQGGRRLPVFNAAGRQVGSSAKLASVRVER